MSIMRDQREEMWHLQCTDYYSLFLLQDVDNVRRSVLFWNASAAVSCLFRNSAERVVQVLMLGRVWASLARRAQAIIRKQNWSINQLEVGPLTCEAKQGLVHKTRLNCFVVYILYYRWINDWAWQIIKYICYFISLPNIFFF